MTGKLMLWEMTPVFLFSGAPISRCFATIMYSFCCTILGFYHGVPRDRHINIFLIITGVLSVRPGSAALTARHGDTVAGSCRLGTVTGPYRAMADPTFSLSSRGRLDHHDASGHCQ
jgi:hypothetical protein